MPKIAKELPAATNSRSPRSPCAPMVRSASTPMTARPEHDGQRAGDAARRQSLLEHEPRQDQPADRGAGRLNDGAVAERHVHVAKIAPQRERQAAAQTSARMPRRQPKPPRSREAASGHDREAARGPARRSGAAPAPAATVPTRTPCRAATKPKAQNKAEPAPHSTPNAVACLVGGGGARVIHRES